ncbi:hypothetical protein [Hymenobacter aerophilus]|uniref:hypothetical protein n=1 Tax=Hymenobacter aerophilus TaxID=119644 RepID=UPI000369F80A|nr:hypothetical protein [Hymenobacter aerophilus]
MKYTLLFGLVLLGACTSAPRRGRSGHLAPEREMMHPDRFPADSAELSPELSPPDSLR